MIVDGSLFFSKASKFTTWSTAFKISGAMSLKSFGASQPAIFAEVETIGFLNRCINFRQKSSFVILMAIDPSEATMFLVN